MPKLGGEEPYDSIPTRGFFDFFKGRKGTKEAEAKGTNGTAGEEPNHTWSLEIAAESGAKTWEVV